MIKSFKYLIILLVAVFLIPLRAEKGIVLVEVNKPESIQFGSGNIIFSKGQQSISMMKQPTSIRVNSVQKARAREKLKKPSLAGL